MNNSRSLPFLFLLLCFIFLLGNTNAYCQFPSNNHVFLERDDSIGYLDSLYQNNDEVAIEFVDKTSHIWKYSLKGLRANGYELIEEETNHAIWASCENESVVKVRYVSKEVLRVFYLKNKTSVYLKRC